MRGQAPKWACPFGLDATAKKPKAIPDFAKLVSVLIGLGSISSAGVVQPADWEGLGLPDSEYLCPATGADTLYCRSFILECDLPRILYLYLFPALHTISCCHGVILLSSEFALLLQQQPSHVNGTLVRGETPFSLRNDSPAINCVAYNEPVSVAKWDYIEDSVSGIITMCTLPDE